MEKENGCVVNFFCAGSSECKFKAVAGKPNACVYERENDSDYCYCDNEEAQNEAMKKLLEVQ
jgi:hypothetical protein